MEATVAPLLFVAWTARTENFTLRVLAHGSSRIPGVRLGACAWILLAFLSLQINKSGKTFEKAVVCPFKIFPYLPVDVVENSALLEHYKECYFSRAYLLLRLTPFSRNVGIHWSRVTSQKNAAPISAFLLFINVKYLSHVFLPRTLTASDDPVYMWNTN